MSGFALNVSKWCDKAEQNLEYVTRRTLEYAAESLVTKTPFGMPETWVKHRAPPGYLPGTARAGWHISSGAPVVAAPSAPDAGGRATIEAMIASLPGKVGGKTFFFSNNVPYIDELERGYSPQQRPIGMMGLTLIELPDMVHNFAIEAAG